MIGKMSARKGSRIRQHTDKVIKAFKKLDVNVGISNNAAMFKKD